MKTKVFIGGIVLLVLIIGGYYFFSSKGGSDSSKTIKVVTSFPMRKIDTGKDIMNGIKLAFEEADYMAGKYKIELVEEDDGDENGNWTVEREKEIAQKAVADSDVMIYMGPFNSGAAKASIPIINKAGFAQISPGNTWPGLTQPGFAPGEPGIFYPTGMRTYFRVCPTDAAQGPACAIWAKEMGVKNVYIFDDGEAYGVGIAGIFEMKAAELGLNILGRETLDKSLDDFKPKLRQIEKQGADLIFFAGITPNGAVPLIKNVKELQMIVKFMGGDGIMDQVFIDESGDAAQGTCVTTVGVPAKELRGKGAEFYKNYLAKYNKEPGAYSSFGYEAAKVAMLAIEKAGVKDRAKILDEVSKIKDYAGLFGTWSFDNNGDTTLTLVSGNVVKDGSFAFEKLIISK